MVFFVTNCWKKTDNFTLAKKCCQTYCFLAWVICCLLFSVDWMFRFSFFFFFSCWSNFILTLFLCVSQFQPWTRVYMSYFPVLFFSYHVSPSVYRGWMEEPNTWQIQRVFSTLMLQRGFMLRVLETDIFKAQIEWNLWTVSSEIKKKLKKTRPTHFYFRLTGYWFSLPWDRKRHFNKLKRQVGHKNLMWILLRKRSSVSQLRCSWGCVLDRGFVVLGTPLLWLHELCWENYRIQLNLYGYNMGCIYNYIYMCVCVYVCVVVCKQAYVNIYTVHIWHTIYSSANLC